MRASRIMIALAIFFIAISIVVVHFTTKQTHNEIDLIGGFTPQETISLYREAIQKNNYYLASRYFILEKQDQEFKNFLSANRHTLQDYIERLTISGEGLYNDEQTLFTLRIPFDGPDFFIRLQKNQFNRWKIIDI